MKWLKKEIIAFSIASLLNDFCFEMTTPLLPSFIQNLTNAHMAPTFIGLIQSVSEGAASAMRLISGWIADQPIAYRPVLSSCYAITGIFSGLIGLAYSVWMVLIFKTIAWMSRGLRQPIRDTWITQIIPMTHYGRAFGFHRSLDTVGSLLGPIVVFILLQWQFKMTTIFFLSLIPGIASALPFFFIDERPKRFIYQKKQLHHWEKIKQLPKPFIYYLCVRLLFGIGQFHQTLLILRAQQLLTGVTHKSIIATGLAILLYSFSNFVKAISEFGIGTLSDFINRRILIAILGFGFFALTSFGSSFTIENFWIWLIIFLLAGASAGTIRSLDKSYSASLLPESIRGLGLGIFQAIEGLGALISSALIGFLWTYFSAKTAFLFATLSGFCSMILLLTREN